MKLILSCATLLLFTACSTTDVVRQKATTTAVTKPTADFSAYRDRPPLLPAYQRVVLANGVVLLLLEKHEVPLIGFEASIRGGAIADPPGRSGTASLLTELLRKGAGERNAEQFADTVEGAGGQIGTGAGVERLYVSGEFLSRDAVLAVELLADMITRPHLDESEFLKIQDRTVQFIRAAKDGSPNRLLPIYAAGSLYGGHPYARPSFGDETSLMKLSIDDVRDFYRDQVGAGRLIISVAGDFETAEMISLLENAFSNWRRARLPLPDYGSPRRVAGGRVLLIDKPDATQTYFWLGNVGVSKYYPERASLRLANTVFGGSFSSMLNTELRIKSGLTYGASSRLSQPRKAGSVGIASFTRTESTVEAIDLALSTLERFRKQGLDQAATDSARAYILGQFPLGFETAGQLAGQMAELEFYGLDIDYINNYAEQLIDADKAGIDRVITEVYPARDELIYVIIGNAAAIRDAVSKYGPVTEMRIVEPRFRPL